MSDKGWIQLKRDILNWEFYKDLPIRVLWLHLLLRACAFETNCMGYRLIPGMLITTLPRLAEETGLTVQQVRTALRKLKEAGELGECTTNKFRILWIMDYDDWVH